ncbi:hypothetical protein M378DRAFT_168737 [Amanita muscaria Koide BX008]|uniref:Uncharacterized protein n=1 Tax=Amanita muscaria (strain Koide BX008) TaxID=946122 RepID=A0A0C2WEN6_AMAMK|nr:hypothetical protein M378DRAFT_168737 [Amanita muscaria Koide BX008]
MSLSSLGHVSPFHVRSNGYIENFSLELFICRARRTARPGLGHSLFNGSPSFTPSKLLLMTEWDFQAKAIFHRITLWTSPSSVQHLVLYLRSFSTLDDSELEEKPPSHYSTTSSLCKSILVPSRPAVYASIIRLLLSYPQYCATTMALQSDLSELIGYDLLGLEDGYLDPNDEEALVAKGLEQRLAHATQVVLQWGIDGVWRPGEEWIGDALGTVIGGTGL